MLLRTLISTISLPILTSANPPSLVRDRGLIPTNDSHVSYQIHGDSFRNRQNANCTAQIDPNLLHLISSNSTTLSGLEETLLDKFLKEEPCYEFTPRSQGGRPIPYSILFRTLALAFDWLSNIWVQSSGREFALPPNGYGLEIRVAHIRILRNRPLSLDSVTFMLDSIAFWMREENKFAEMDAAISNRGAVFAVLTVRLVPPTVSSISSSNGLEYLNSEANRNISAISGQGHSNGTWESIDTSSSAQELNAVSTRNPFISNLRSDITRFEALGQAVATELDLMSNLITIARLAVELGRAGEVHSYIRPDHTCTTVEPCPGNDAVDAGEVAESLLDLIEWEYQQLTQTGSFFCAQVVTKRRVSRAWKYRHLISVSWIRTDHASSVASS